jgi:hypothetical protein
MGASQLADLSLIVGWVKLRRTRPGQIFSGVLFRTDIARRGPCRKRANSGHRQRTMYSPIIVTERIVLLEV